MLQKFKLFDNQYPEEIISTCLGHKNRIFRKERLSKTRPTLLEVENPKPYEFYDVFEIQDFTYSEEEGGGHLKVQLSLLQYCPNMVVSAQIVDLNSNTVIDTLEDKSDIGTSILVLDKDYKINADNSDVQLGVVAIGKWGTKSIEENEVAIFKEANSREYVWKYDHDRPKKEKEAVILGDISSMEDYNVYRGDKDHIVIALYRAPEDKTDVDYICGARVGQEIHIVCVPGRGDVSFPINNYQLPSGSQPTAYCRLYNKSGGAALIAATPEYEIDEKNLISIQPKGNGYHYEFMSWGTKYKEPGGWIKTEFDYELTLNVPMYSKVKRKIQNFEIIIGSTENAGRTGESTKTLPLQIMYGCVAPDTGIQMENGEIKPICEVKIGDIIKGKDKLPMRVHNVWKGPEFEKMLEIHAKDSRNNEFCVFVTKSHPMWVKAENGSMEWRRAEACKIGDVLLCESGEYVPILEIVEKEPCEEVYNLELQPLDSKDTRNIGMFCNGILTGDNNIQNGLGGEA